MPMKVGATRTPMKDRFWAKVDICGPDECWPWTAKLNAGGYGWFYVDPERGSQLASRVAWFLAHDEWPTRYVLHVCDNPPCVNRRHLIQGTAAENAADMVRKGRVYRGNRGEGSGKAKLTNVQVENLRRLREAGVSFTELGQRFGIHPSHAWRIFRMERWPVDS